MKLVRYGKAGQEKPGIIDTDGNVRSVVDLINDWDGEHLTAKVLAKIAKINPAKLPLVKPKTRLGPPIARPAKFVAIGLNFADHAAESNLPIPKEPVVFNKWTSCIQGPNDDVMLPKGSVKTDWEVELGVVIGTRARSVSKKDALNHVVGYCLVNDVSEREWQIERGMTWDKGKGFDTFGPIGPWLVTADEVGNPQKLGMWLDVNGARQQTGNTKTMIFDVATIVSYCSTLMTLEPGDIITTGTPPGVGMGKKPNPVFLKPGDVITLGIDKLGEAKQTVVKFSPPKA
ncbi:MAG TPA: fumarylacetoacetate hydrolase family protein [Casimicrobium huifangae]|jgi:2-keto-4-pentenoate hydratase/2-oxohepta-3-ene-1,7-dioic acid hydratase in catechol pathway|nr:fumarylacetoacetate hydrolase family protein [Casimicrobium huifangae]HQA35088.1 fumarylacetoacetate hydrolase family protein [Casimicrobium huifangae]HQD64749.1 fumarylacetoacetate hydrolase family protein [Casimicrobium huifangae]